MPHWSSTELCGYALGVKTDAAAYYAHYVGPNAQVTGITEWAEGHVTSAGSI